MERVVSLPAQHVSRELEETRVPKINPCGHKENMQNSRQTVTTTQDRTPVQCSCRPVGHVHIQNVHPVCT